MSVELATRTTIMITVFEYNYSRQKSSVLLLLTKFCYIQLYLQPHAIPVRRRSVRKIILH